MGTDMKVHQKYLRMKRHFRYILRNGSVEDWCVLDDKMIGIITGIAERRFKEAHPCQGTSNSG